MECKMKSHTFELGDKVKLTRDFLRACALYTGGFGQMRGTVEAIRILTGIPHQVLTVRWATSPYRID
jgi:hypothetical protein